MLVVGIGFPGDDVACAAHGVGSLVEEPAHRADHVEDVLAAGFAGNHPALGKLAQIAHLGQHRRADAGHLKVSNMIAVSTGKVSQYPSKLVRERLVRAELSHLHDLVSVASQNLDGMFVAVTPAAP